MRSFSIRWPAACCSLLRLFCKTETVRLFSRGENLKKADERVIYNDRKRSIPGNDDNHSTTSIIDPKNRAIAGELNLCIDELADYFIGKNSWQTTSETLKRYYNAFL